jgi:hypothetical protein
MELNSIQTDHHPSVMRIYLEGSQFPCTNKTNRGVRGSGNICIGALLHTRTHQNSHHPISPYNTLSKDSTGVSNHHNIALLPTDPSIIYHCEKITILTLRTIHKGANKNTITEPETRATEQESFEENEQVAETTTTGLAQHACVFEAGASSERSIEVATHLPECQYGRWTVSI